MELIVARVLDWGGAILAFLRSLPMGRTKRERELSRIAFQILDAALVSLRKARSKESPGGVEITQVEVEALLDAIIGELSWLQVQVKTQ